MSIRRLSPVELRVLGCLIEKQRTTPEQYPLTLNSLRLACNQATNREPVLELDETEVRNAAQRLGTYGYARLATGPGSRTAKYRQLFSEALDLLPSQTSLMAVLFLRGPQTVNELKTRTTRLARIDDVGTELERLADKELVELQPRQSGQREERWAHLLADEPALHTDEAEAEPGEPAPLERRVAQLERRLGEMERLLAEHGLLATAGRPVER